MNGNLFGRLLTIYFNILTRVSSVARCLQSIRSDFRSVGWLVVMPLHQTIYDLLYYTTLYLIYFFIYLFNFICLAISYSYSSAPASRLLLLGLSLVLLLLLPFHFHIFLRNAAEKIQQQGIFYTL